MTIDRSSAAFRVRSLGAITAVAAILPALGMAGQPAWADSRDNKKPASALTSRRTGSDLAAVPVENARSLTAPTERLRADLLTVPLSFEPNQGQTAAEAQFLSRGSGYALFLDPGVAVLKLERQPPASTTGATGQKPEAASVDTLRMSLIGANPNANAVGLAPQPGVVSYFIGNDPKQWRSAIPTYGKVEYPQIYPGVDLVFYGNQRQLEYDFVAAPGADPTRIAWRIDGARASIDAEGDLVLNAPHGPAGFQKPVVYQMDGDKKTNVEGAFVVAGDRVRFRLGSYDHSRPLIIDPVLSYVTYLAGSSADYIGQTTAPLSNSSSQGLAIDAAGSAYVTGRTFSADFPTKNAYQGAPAKGGNPSVFVTKFSPDGSSLVYSTYLAGIGWDYADAIAVDSSGSAYVTGNTNSNDFPITSGAYQTLCSPSPSTPPGTVTKATCYTNNSAFVTKLNPAGTGLVYSTFLGGYGGAEGTAIAVDSAGRAYIAGNENAPCNLSYTFPACFPTTSGATIQTINANNVTNFCFAAVFDPTGANLLYSTLFGDLNGLKTSTTTTSGGTWAIGMTVDSNGYFYLIGDTKAGKLPTTPGAVQPSSVPLDTTGSFVTAFRGFIAKFNPVASGASLAACTYLGGKTGNTSDYLNGIAIDSSGNIYAVGYTNSSDFPVTSGAYSTACGAGGTCDAGHLTKLNPSLTSIVWSTYLGGSRQDGGDDWYFIGPVQLDGKGNVYVTGIAGTRFPLLNPVEPAGSGGAAGLVVVELDPTGSSVLFSTGIGSGGLDSMQTGGLAVDPTGVIYVAGNNIGADLITTPGAFETTNPSPTPTCCYHGFVAKISPTAFLTPPLSAQGASIAASAGGGSFQVNAAPGSAWTAFSSVAWITITSGASGTGSGIVTFTVAANSGGARSGTIDIGGQIFTIDQESASASGLSFAGSMAQIASAGGWDTSLTLVNLGAAQGEARLNFYANDGTTPQLPFTFPLQPSLGTTLGATFDQTLNANATLILDTTGSSQTATVGSSQLLTSGNIGGFAIFTYTPSGQAAVAPLETRNAASYLLPFDNTGAISTGLAIANVAASAASVNVIIRDDTGAQIGTGSVNLAAEGHNSFMLTDATSGFPVTAGKRGTVEFDRPTGGQISVLGLRANAIPNSTNFAVTTIPLLASVSTGGGVMAHIASGGGWQTTCTLVNIGASSATASLNFYGDNGSAVSLPLSFPQTGALSSASNVSQSIAPGASLIVVVQDSGSATSTTGSAVLTTTANVSGFAMFRYNPTGQEAVAPLEAVNAGSYVLAFDNTGSLTTGLAIANVSAQAANVSVVMRDDTGAQIGTGSIGLKAQGHTSFMLTDATYGFPVTANKRGTIEFDTPSGGRIAPLGLRAGTISGGFTITTIPVLTK